MESESKKLDSLPPKQDPIFETDTQKLFERVKAKVEAIKAAQTANACNIPSHDISASIPEKAYPLEKKNENGERDYLCDLPNVSQREEVTAATDPLLFRNLAHSLLDMKNNKKMKKKKTTDIKIQALLEQSDNISLTTGPTSIDPVKASLVQELPEDKKKKNLKEKKNKKKMTAHIKIQTLLKQLDNIYSIVRCCPTCFDPVKECLLQVLPEYEVPVPVSSNFGPNPEFIKCENDNITALKPKEKKMEKKEKTTNIKIQTLLEQSDNISPMVECGPASLDQVKESLVQELPEDEVPVPVSSNFEPNPKSIKCENDNITALKPKEKTMKKKKKKTTNIKIQTLLEQSDYVSPMVECGPAGLDPVKESLVRELPEDEVPVPVSSNFGPNPEIIKCENDNITALKPKEKTMKKKKKKTTNIKIQTLLEQSDYVSPMVECGPASLDPVKESLVRELPEDEVPVPVSSNFGPNPEIIKCENDNITALKPTLKPKEKTMKKKKKKTTNIKIQTLLEQSDYVSPMVECGPASLDPVKESLVRELPEDEVPVPMSSNFGPNPEITKCENDNITALKPKEKKMIKKKKKTTNIKIQTLLEQSDNLSPMVECGPASLDPVKESLVQELPEDEVPVPASSNFGPNPEITKCENDNITALKPKDKKMIKKKKKTTNIKIQTLLEQSNNISPMVECGPASLDPVKESLVRELQEDEVPVPVSSNFGPNPEITKCENDNITALKPKEKKMIKKKKKTTNIKIQTLPEQSDNLSPMVECGPASLDPVKESLVQELPEDEVPVPVSSNFGPNPEITKCENDNITALKPKEKKMIKKKKKTTNIKIQTLLEQTDNISPMVGCGPASLDPVKESLVQELPEYQNIKHESWPKKQDPLSEEDLEKSLEEVKVNIEALEDAGNPNAHNIPFHDMSASTPDKTYPLEKIIEKEEGDCLGDLLNFPQGAKRDEGMHVV